MSHSEIPRERAGRSCRDCPECSPEDSGEKDSDAEARNTRPSPNRTSSIRSSGRNWDSRGCAIVILFFLILFGRGLLVASRAADSYGRSVGTGLLTVLATQTFLNIGGVTKFVPLTGLPLPFISHGGSSLITGFIGAGLLLAISDGQPANPLKSRTAKQTNGVTGKGVRRSRRASAD